MQFVPVKQYKNHHFKELDCVCFGGDRQYVKPSKQCIKTIYCTVYVIDEFFYTFLQASFEKVNDIQNKNNDF